MLTVRQTAVVPSPRPLLSIPKKVRTGNVVMDANLRAAHTREKLLCPLGASVVHRTGFSVVDTLTVTPRQTNARRAGTSTQSDAAYGQEGRVEGRAFARAWRAFNGLPPSCGRADEAQQRTVRNRARRLKIVVAKSRLGLKAKGKSPECDLSRYRRPISAALPWGTSIGGRS